MNRQINMAKFKIVVSFPFILIYNLLFKKLFFKGKLILFYGLQKTSKYFQQCQYQNNGLFCSNVCVNPFNTE